MPYIGPDPAPVFDPDISVNSITTSGNAVIGGTLGVTGATTLSSTATVSGASEFNGTVDVDADFAVRNGTTDKFTIASLTGNASTSGTLGVTGEITATGGGTVKATYQERFATVTSSSGAATLDLSTANYFAHTLSEATTYTFSNPPSSGTAFTFTLELKQDSGGSAYATTWPNTVDFAGGTEPTDSSGANEVDIYVFTTRDGGTTYFGFQSGADMS